MLKKKKSRNRASHKRIRFRDINIFLGVLVLALVGLFIVERGTVLNNVTQVNTYLKKSQAKTPDQALSSTSKTVLALYDSTNETSVSAIDDFKQVFVDMKVGVDYVDLASQKNLPDFSTYESVVILTSNIEPLGENAITLMDYVHNGGSVMFAMTLQNDSVLSTIEAKLGIINSAYDYKVVNSLKIKNNFMLGDSRTYTIDEGFDSARAVELSEDAKIYLTTGDDEEVPLIWSYDYGEGRVVVDNMGLYGKAYRGFYSSSYSLMTEVGAYPVINAAAFTLDDFPSPEPSGDSTYVTRDYGLSISSFYSDIWWPNMQKLAKKYGIKYSGVIIETYTDDTSGSTEKQTDTSRFTYFGNMLLNMGGEIGYHGYNHQPLNLTSDTDYGEDFSYNTWTSETAIIDSFTELAAFTKKLFPKNSATVYVPPSNVMSEKTRNLLVENFPEIRTIASNYFSDNFVYSQEFEVSSDGIIESPRTTSGAIIDNYTKLTAVSELNMHYISHHFIHPDDALDVDRGAELGWGTLYKNLSNQMKWLYQSAPDIRNTTESQFGGAVQRFSSINIKKTITDDTITFELGNFVDEAYLMVRVNEGNLGKVEGGSLKHLTGNLYLLKAEQETVTIQRTKE